VELQFNFISTEVLSPTISQCHHCLLAAQVPQGKHGAVAFKQWQTFIEQSGAQLWYALPWCWRGWVYRAVRVLIYASILQLVPSTTL